MLISLPACFFFNDTATTEIYTTIGCIPWTAALAYAGYAVGTNWESIVNGFRGPTYIIAAVVVLGLAIAIWRYARRRRADSATASGQRPQTEGRSAGGDQPKAPGEEPDTADRRSDIRARR
jgi:hypothetical protein